MSLFKYFLLVGVLIIASQNLLAEKFNLKMNLPRGHEYEMDSKVIKTSFLNGEYLSSDTIAEKSKMEIISKTDRNYKMRIEENIGDFSKVTGVEMEDIIMNINPYGKLQSIDNEDDVYNMLYKIVTQPTKMILNAIPDEEKRKEAEKSMDSVFKIAFSKERMMTLVTSSAAGSDFSEYIGMEYEDTTVISSEYLLPMLGEIETKKRVYIRKDEQQKRIIIKTYEQIPPERYVRLVNYFDQLAGKETLKGLDILEFNVSNELHLDWDTRFPIYRKSQKETLVSSDGGNRIKSIEETISELKSKE